MDMAELNRIAQHGLRGEFRLNEPMHEHTSWRAGGPARSRLFPARSRSTSRGSCARSRRTSRIMSSVWAATCWCATEDCSGTVVFTHGALERDPRSSQSAERCTLVYAEAGVPVRRSRASPRTMICVAPSSWPEFRDRGRRAGHERGLLRHRDLGGRARRCLCLQA